MTVVVFGGINLKLSAIMTPSCDLRLFARDSQMVASFRNVDKLTFDQEHPTNWHGQSALSRGTGVRKGDGGGEWGGGCHMQL